MRSSFGILARARRGIWRNCHVGPEIRLREVVSRSGASRFVVVRDKECFVTKDERAESSAPKLVENPMRWGQDVLTKHFLPAHYPASVRPSYVNYVRWQAAAYVAASASGVLSTQALLFAVGIGATTALPMAAAINWVLKDGLGQLGGILFASAINRRFDAEPKRWRLYAAAALDASTMLEVLVPLAPGMFLVLASAANAGKNISWLAASASRAGIHQSFAAAGNLADITAKTGSQTIATSLIGTALGIAISPVVGSSTATVLPVCALLAGFHLACNYAAVQHVTMTTLNWQRADLVLWDLLYRGRVGTPEEVAARERILLPPPGGRFGLRVHVAPPLERVASCAQAAEALRAQTARAEHAAAVLPAPSLLPPTGAADRALRPLSRLVRAVAARLRRPWEAAPTRPAPWDAVALARAWAASVASADSAAGAGQAAPVLDSAAVALVLREGASAEAELRGYLKASCVRALLLGHQLAPWVAEHAGADEVAGRLQAAAAETGWGSVRATVDAADALADRLLGPFLEQLREQGWDTSVSFVDNGPGRRLASVERGA